MNILDIVLLICFAVFLISGFKRGVIKELVSLVGIIAVFFFSFSFKGIIGNFLCYILPFFKFKGPIAGLTTINIMFYQIIAFLIIYFLLIGIYHFCVRISKIIQKAVNMTIILIIPSKILGAIVSLLKGYMIIYAVLLLVMIPFGSNKDINESVILNGMIYNTPILSGYVNSFVQPVKEIYELGDKVSKKEISTNDANLKSLDIMLKYKVVNKKVIEKLVDMKKLDNIDNIDSVLSKY